MRKWKGLGFDVKTKINPTKREMNEPTNELIDRVQPGDIVLFDFSGHGVQV